MTCVAPEGGAVEQMMEFEALFGRAPSVFAEAHGRVNLIGEHTDYNGGFVLPTLIPQTTRVALAPSGDRRVRVWSANVDRAEACIEFVAGQERRAGRWIDYVQGITVALARAGHAPGGFDARIESSVPVGSGLSSSAALEVAVLRALREAFSLPIDDVGLALLGQKAENDFVGAPVGIMDQMCASLASDGTALFLDARTLEYERVPLPAGADLIVIGSGIPHRLAAGDGGYATRRRQCEEAARRLGVDLLRGVGEADLTAVAALEDPLDRRARHVITENARVLAAVEAMRAQDLRRLGQLFAASHASMRDDYEVSVPEIDLMVGIACEEADVYGARLTGGGFGGSVVMLARRGHGRAAADRIADRYARESGRTPVVHVPEAAPTP